MVFLIKGCNRLSAGSSGPPALPPPTVPQPVVSNVGSEYKWYFSGSGWSVWYAVTNRGAPGQITVHCSVPVGNQTLNDQHTWMLGTGESKSDDHFFIKTDEVS